MLRFRAPNGTKDTERPLRMRSVRASISLLFTAAIAICLQAAPSAAQSTWPTTPPAAICGNTQLLSGPAAPPPGAIVVPAGPNNGTNWNQPGATFWFAPGVHTLGDDLYGQIIPGDDTTFIGAPGAVIDGRNLNLRAFTQRARNVTIRYLEIRNFGTGASNNNQGVVNHDAGFGWTIEYNYVHDNDGAGVFIGSGNTVRYNCLKDNGQYGFSAYHEHGVTNVVLDHNEIVGNNRDNWEVLNPGCGCTGGGKFWDTRAAVITNNWVHDNLGPGLWADHNNAEFLFEGNLTTMSSSAMSRTRSMPTRRASKAQSANGDPGMHPLSSARRIRDTAAHTVCSSASRAAADGRSRSAPGPDSQRRQGRSEPASGRRAAREMPPASHYASSGSTRTAIRSSRPTSSRSPA